MAWKRYRHGGGKSAGVQHVVVGLVALITLWLLMFVFDKILDAITGTFTINSSVFADSEDLLNAVPTILGLLGSIFIVMYVIKGFKSVSG